MSVSDVEVASTGSGHGDRGTRPTTNTKAAPDTVTPVNREIDGLSIDFSYDFPPYSITFLTMHTVRTRRHRPSTRCSSRPTPRTATARHPRPSSPPRPTTARSTTSRLSVDGGPWTSTDDPTTISVQVDGHGEHTVQVRATDAAGNVSTVRSTTFRLDAIAPTTSASVDVAKRRVKLDATDTGSGVERIEYRLGAGPWTTYHGQVKVGADAAVVEHRAVDKVGNVGPTTSTAVPAPPRR